MGSDTVQSAKNGTFTNGKERATIPVSLNRAPKILLVLNSKKYTAGLDNTASQSESGTQGNIDGNTSSSPNLNDPKHAKYAADQIVGQRGTEKQTECKV